jgi:hypothetical protein
MILQLNPTIPLETSKGFGWAIMVIVYSQEHSLIWTVILENGQIWNCPNEEVRGCTNWTMLRPAPEKPKEK